MRRKHNRKSPATFDRTRVVWATPLIWLFGAVVSAQPIQVVDDVPGSFMDISGSQPLAIGGDDEIEIGTSVGNLVFPPGSIVVANNGGVAFRDPPSNDLAPENQPIPSSAAFGGGQAILLYWDDLDDKDGDVYLVQEEGRLIVQWHNRPLGSNPTSTVRFQLQIPVDPGPRGIVAQLVFTDIEQAGVEGGLSATIGYQDGGAGFEDAQWSFNTAGAVSNGTVLSLVVAEPTSDAVPAASGWSVIIASLLMATIGTFAVRRRFTAGAA